MRNIKNETPDGKFGFSEVNSKSNHGLKKKQPKLHIQIHRKIHHIPHTHTHTHTT